MDRPVRIARVSKKAAGLPGVWAAIRHMVQYMKPGEAWKASHRLNQKNGFDCPGCAWPDPDDERSRYFEYCENGIKAIAEEASKKQLWSNFFQSKTLKELRNWTDFELGKNGRICEPMCYQADLDTYVSISWDQAIKDIAKFLESQSDPDRSIFYTSGRTSNEAAFLYQLLVRKLGTNNLPDCSNMCHEASGKGLGETLGIGKGSVTLSDIHQAELILVMGQNPGTNHPRMLSALEKCKQSGGRIIAINPLPETGLVHFVNPQKPIKVLSGGTPLADLFLPVRINGDIALLKAIMILLLQRHYKSPCLDQEFIDNRTTGFEELKTHLQASDLSTCLAQAGIKREQVEEAVDWIANSSKMIVCWAMGITQHVNGVQNVREIVNLLLLKGAIGKPGAGTCPVRGHSNVQGDRTMGIWESPPDSFLNRLENHFGFSPPRNHGWSAVEAIEAMKDGRADFFMAMGGNFISASPDTQTTQEVLSQMDMTVHVSTKLNRSHLFPGKQSYILPVLGRSEIDIQKRGPQFVTVENSMGKVHRSQGVLPPRSDLLKSEIAVVSLLGQNMRKTEQLPWDQYAANYDRIRDEIEAVIPGFDQFNQRIQKDDGFYLPNGARNGEFHTPSGKAVFTINPLPESNPHADSFTLMTMRSHDQFNTTIYGLADRYRGIQSGRDIVFMNEMDLLDLGIKPFERVTLISEYDRIRILKNIQVVPFDIPQKCIAMYFPEANALIPVAHHDPISKTPASKNIAVRIETELKED